jgi:hypothetical protein
MVSSLLVSIEIAIRAGLVVHAQTRRIESRQAARIERVQARRMSGSVDDQLRRCLAGRRRIENAPDAVPGGD